MGNGERFEGKVWRADGPGGWYFVTSPEELSAILRHGATDARRAWGSIRVTATIGKTTWSTSLFPDTKRNAYLLPVKADVRKGEKLVVGVSVTVTIRLG